MKKIIVLVLLVAVFGAAAFFYMKAQELQQETDALQSLVQPAAPQPKDVGPYSVVISWDQCGVGTYGDDNYEALYGTDAKAYCEGTANHVTAIEACLHEGLRIRNNILYSYGSVVPTPDEYKPLACDIAASYPLEHEDALENDLGNPLGSLVGDILSTK